MVIAVELDACFRGAYEGSQPGVPGFLYWRKFCAESAEIVRPGEAIDSVGGSSSLAADTKEAFNALFPDESFVQGARSFPSRVPLFADEPEVAENKAAWKVLEEFSRPFMLAFADDDPVTASMAQPFLDSMPGCQGVEHRTIGPAGHFLQQDQPAQCVQAIVDIAGP